MRFESLFLSFSAFCVDYCSDSQLLLRTIAKTKTVTNDVAKAKTMYISLRCLRHSVHLEVSRFVWKMRDAWPQCGSRTVAQ